MIKETLFYKEIGALLDSKSFLIQTKDSCQALLIKQQTYAAKRPLFVIIHGGPFASNILSKYYSFVNQTLLENGINILLVNFEGSTGYGLKAIENLLGNAGKNDVKDCKELIFKII